MMEITVSYQIDDAEEKRLQAVVEMYRERGINFTKETMFEFIMRTSSVHDIDSKLKFHEQTLDLLPRKGIDVNNYKQGIGDMKTNSSTKNAYEIVMDSRKKLVESLISQMEKGYAETKAAWSSRGGRPYNPTSNAVYKGGNRFRLMLEAEQQGFKDPRWMTFKQADENNYKVKAGSKGVLLEKWISFKEVPVLDENQQPVYDTNGKLLKELEKLKNPVVSYFRVFNGEQIEGLPALEQKVRTEDMYSRMADDFERSSKCPIHFGLQNQAYYSPSKDEIQLPAKETFKSNEARLAVQLHEMAHSTGHSSRLNRPIQNSFGSIEYAKEELNAELSSAFLESELGISLEPDSEAIKDHSNYLKSWISVLKDDPSEFFKACTVAEEITEYLMKNYELELEQSKQVEAQNERIEVAIESTDDYATPEFHKNLVDIYTQNADGTYGKVENHFRVVHISENGYLEPIDNAIYPSYEEAQNAIDPSKYVVVNYDRMVDKAHIAIKFCRELDADIKCAGFKPTESLVNNIKEFCKADGKRYTLKELATLHKTKPDFSKEPKKQECFEKIIKECKDQEMARGKETSQFFKKEIQMELVNIQDM